MGLSKTWVRHIETWQGSGQSQSTDCRQNGLNTHTFAARLSDYCRSHRSDAAAAVIPIQVQPQ